MNLTVGNKVNYPHQGPCLIDEVVDRVVDGRSMSFYHLAILDDSGGRLLVPTDKIQALGIRQLLESLRFRNCSTTSHRDNHELKQRAIEH
jgi:RNA polymerase-interacting CarD/CdnL/TRCF family regulator